MTPDEALNDMIASCIHSVHIEMNRYLADPFPSQPWETLTASQKDVVIGLVLLIRTGGTYEEAQDRWVRIMEGKGWAYGPLKDPLARPKPTHPCMKKWGDLSGWDRRKVIVAFRIVYALTLES